MLETGQTELFEEAEREMPERDMPSAREAPPRLSALFELSVDAFYSIVHAQMSGLPLREEISRFITKVGKAADRDAANRIASDRGDPDVLAVQRAAGKVRHEIHRIMGFLRFSPDPGGVYTARCAPEYFILPALAGHFTLRFGETSWAVIDEKRGLCLSRAKGGEAKIVPLVDAGLTFAGKNPPGENTDMWEDLWRLYHRSVTNESRKNLKLQRQFMPERYRKYLNELK
jgi:probable DNA metabolism protein